MYDEDSRDMNINDEQTAGETPEDRMAASDEALTGQAAADGGESDVRTDAAAAADGLQDAAKPAADRPAEQETVWRGQPARNDGPASQTYPGQDSGQRYTGQGYDGGMNRQGYQPYRGAYGGSQSYPGYGDGQGWQQRMDGSGYRQGADGTGWQQRPDGSGYQQGTDGWGYQQRMNGYRQSADGAGWQQGSDGSGYQQRPEGSGYQQKPEGSGYQQSADGQDSQQGQGNIASVQKEDQSHQDSQRRPKEKKKKKAGLFKKTAGVVAAALLFGVVSGGTMVGVNILAESMKEEEETTAATVIPSQERTTLSDEELNRIVTDLNRNSGATAAVMDVSDIVEDVMPSVVAINNTMLYQSMNPWFGGTQTYEVPSAGSGIIVGQNNTELLIATNNHVVEDASKLSVVFIDDKEVEATVKGTDSTSDLAIVAVNLSDIPAETVNAISVAELGDSDELKIGQGVIAIGNALGYGQAVTVGYISALNRQVTTEGTTRNLLQTDAAINPGNSGGALLNMQGQVIGINEAKYSDTDVEGMGFAIPISQAQEILESLMVRRSGEKVEEDEAGYLGIQGLTVDESMIRQYDMPEGVYVYRIVEGGAAASTDLREKDVIVSLDGQKIRTMADLQDLLQYYKKGETVEMIVKSLEYGEYVDRTITITLGDQVTGDE